jgi:outer membrane protein OmpA-like peptidoglycan-associated protein
MIPRMRNRHLAALGIVLSVGLAGCCICQKTGPPQPPPPPPQKLLDVDVVSDPGVAFVSFKGKEIGSTPASLGVATYTELLSIGARREGQEAVERRIRFLSPSKAQVAFRFGEPGPLARRLGLTRVLVFDFSDNVAFDSGKAELKADGLAVLEKQAEVLSSAFDDVDVFVCGHTDSTGSDALNLRLSLERAQVVTSFLTGKGVLAARLKPEGFGKEYPVESNATPEGRALNRRTELVLPQ